MTRNRVLQRTAETYNDRVHPDDDAAFLRKVWRDLTHGKETVMAEKTRQELIEEIQQEDYSGEPMPIQTDTYGQPYIEWEQADNAYKRAWIQHRTKDKDWAGTGRYLNVVRCQARGQIGGNPTDFPIYNDLPDEQVLRAFVSAANAITGWKEGGE